MKLRVVPVVTLLTLFSGLAMAQEPGETLDHAAAHRAVRAEGRGDNVRSHHRFFTPQGDASTGAVTTGNGITYNNGPVMLGDVHLYYIWYGNWASAAAGTNPSGILTDFALNIGNSPYFAINKTYGDLTGSVSGSVVYVGQTSDSGTSTLLSDTDIATIVVNTLSSGRLPTDPAGVYVVLTAPGVGTTTGFLSQYCGWHTYLQFNGVNVKYAFVGDAAGPSLAACASQTTSSPNGNPGVDAMASVLAHELEETVTDPQLNAWYDATGYENADKCAWTFGTKYAAAGGGSANMKLGSRDFLIQQNWVNAAGGYCSLTNLAPTLAALSPSGGKQGTSVPVTLTGTNFVSGATLAVGGAGVTVSGVTVVNATTMTATFNTSSTATIGAHAVTVTTARGTSSAASFTVAATAPTLTSMTPSSGKQGTSIAVTLTGTGFLSGATLAVGGVGVTPSSVAVVNATTITATFAVGTTATLGAHTVAVSTSSGTSGTVSFTVLAPAPTLTSMTPSSGVQGATVAVTLTGTNFIAGATVVAGGTGLTVSGVTVASATTLTAAIAVGTSATLGAHTVAVTTSGGTSASVTFTVTPPAPTLTSISPSSGKQGSTVSVTLAGTNLLSGATVAVGGTGVTVSGLTVVNATKLTATLTVAATATPGAHTVAVTTAGGTSSTVSFTVLVPPTVASISPASGKRGTTVLVTLTGTNFVAGATLAVSGNGITVSSVTVVNATTITATLAVGSNITVGARTVAVTTGGGTSGTVTFTVL